MDLSYRIRHGWQPLAQVGVNLNAVLLLLQVRGARCEAGVVSR
jgi:hypothetical protein